MSINSQVEQYYFRLKPGSPSIGIGFKGYTAKVDCEGIARPASKKFDVGACEYAGQK